VVTDKSRVIFYLDEKLKLKLQQLAKRDRRSLSGYLEVLIVKHLQEQGIKVEEEE
jgi:predicted transcriptional regulator